MKDLADAVLDYFWFLYSPAESGLESQRSVKLVELFNQIEDHFTNEEKQALMDAATRRLQQLQNAHDAAYVFQQPQESIRESFLQSIAAGHFDFATDDDVRDPDQLYDE
jgi:sensor histidine kinase YesM